MPQSDRDFETGAAMTAAAEIGAQDIRKSYGTFNALTDISLTVGAGEFLTLLGPSGSGKTTFLMIIAGFEAASAGRLFLNGEDVTHSAAEARGFGMVFQGYALFPHMTAEQNIAFPLKVQRRSTAEIKRRTQEMIEMVGLGGHGHKRPSGLSGGQQQRVALARALAYEPSALLLDEPFSALDKNLRGQMQDEVRRLHCEIGTTFVFVTHDQSEALALSSRVAIFDHGRLQQIDAPREVYERPASRFVAEFLGDINILPLTDGRFEGHPITAGADAGAPSKYLGVRPEYMQLQQHPPEAGNAIAARLEDLTYLGSETRLSLRTKGDMPLILNVATATLPAGLGPGAEVWATWPQERGLYL